MKRIITFLLMACLFCVPASADELYKESLEAVDFSSVEDGLSDSAKEYLEKYNIDVYDPNWISEVSDGNLFSIIADFFAVGFDEFKNALAVTVAVLLLWAVFRTFSPEGVASSGVDTAFTVILSLSVTVPVLKLITAVSSAIKAGGVFMLSFIPVFCGIAAASGGARVAASGGTLLLFAAEVTVQIIAFIVVPIASAELALALSGALSDVSPASRLSVSLKKATGYIMTLTFTVFLGLLSIQTAIGSAADGVYLKTVKFVVGSFVPVAGSALSETIATLGSSVKILQSGVGVYGIFAVLFTVLPVAAQLVLWRLTFWAGKTASEMLGVKAGTKIISAIDNTAALLLGVLLFVGALFIIALAVLINQRF